MKSIPLLLLVLFTCVLIVSTNHAAGDVTLRWHDSVRDVYIDNELDRQAQFLVSENPARAALISPKLDKAIVFDITTSTLFSLAKESFNLSSDRTEGTSNSQFVPIGKFTRIEGPVYSCAVDGRPVLIRPHPGQTGEMNLQKLWETVPVWKGLMDEYQPAANTVASLKSEEKDTTLTLYFGTWCSDSRRYVPRLLKALATAGNSRLHVTLVGIDSQFREPSDVIQTRALTNVPTVVVEREGREIGRIIETPATKTFEDDLVAILSGKPGVHDGRWDRGPLVARGVYSYRDQNGKECGTESWELFNASEGGYFIHSRITMADLSTEVYQRIDASGRPAFAEVTKVRGDNRTRTRISVAGRTLTARVRGSASGVITQILQMPREFFLSSPAIASQAWSQPADVTGRRKMAAYLEPFEFEKTTGGLSPAVCEAMGRENVTVPAGDFQTRHYLRTCGGETSEWWVHPSLGVPVKGRANGGLEFVLVSLDARHQG
jgi:hypothetical protein